MTITTKYDPKQTVFFVTSDRIIKETKVLYLHLKVSDVNDPHITYIIWPNDTDHNSREEKDLYSSKEEAQIDLIKKITDQ